ncbi:hypothetical protein AWC13_00780 [Mycobacterium kubicae]|nr:hypothetical protein [Mycobacterium kubicae]MCV7096688.1 hypothetical protein [Mycobacterium kubicae]ORW04246.1 hypothetical protein AWC13_00780 [Mycobacterium kubicae]QNI11058.1 hypothetical protein GAN18_07435 [Mycobacterium kubicae]QPI39270.1 hypothetical protein I2456_07300 [Mycobacterium kubicae]
MTVTEPGPAPITNAHTTPATYNSPTTPGGSGRRHSSSTNNAKPGAGEPIGAASDFKDDTACRGALNAT